MSKMTLLLATLLFMPLATAGAATFTVGVVDFHAVIKEQPASITTNKKLQKQLEAEQENFAKYRKDMRTMMIGRGEDGKDEKKLTMEDRKKMQEGMRAVGNKMRELQLKMQEEQQKAQLVQIARIEETVQTVAKKEKLNLVLKKHSVAFVEGKTDITQLVIDTLKKTTQ